MYTVEVKKKVLDFVDTLPNMFTIRQKLGELKAFKGQQRLHLDIERIRGTKNSEQLYRLRIGDVRFIFHVFKDKKIIYVKAADYRGNIYK